MEVIRAIRLGLDNNQIAEKLFVAPTTINKHIQNIYFKAEVTKRIELNRKQELPEPDL